MPVAYNKQISPANGKHAQVTEEIYQTLMSNRKLGHIDKVRAAHIIKTTSFRITGRNTVTSLLHRRNSHAQILFMPISSHTYKQSTFKTAHFILRKI
jgi:hypothetical protein